MSTFLLHMAGKGGKYSLRYDIEANALTDMDGAPVDLSPAGYKYPQARPDFKPVHSVSPDNPGRKSRKAKLLKIQLGLGCNYACSYCSQSSHKDEADKTSREDAYAFMSNLDEWLDGKPEKIELWGGEPLLYWEKIKVIVPQMRERFPDATMSVVTNGTLLTRQKVDFLRENRVRVTISHDGPGQALRGADPFDDPRWVATVQYLYDTLGVHFHMVMTKQNVSPSAAVKWVRDRLDRPVVCNVESIVDVHHSGGADALTDADLDEVRANLFNDIASGKCDAMPVIQWKLEDFFTGLSLGIPLASRGQQCGMDLDDTLAVDLHGNVLTCQNVGAATHKIGHVDDFDGIRLNTSKGHAQRAECGACPVVHLCLGSCMFLDGLEFDLTCRNQYAANMGVFQAALYFITGDVLTAVVPEQKVPGRRFIPIKAVA